LELHTAEAGVIPQPVTVEGGERTPVDAEREPLGSSRRPQRQWHRTGHADPWQHRAVHESPKDGETDGLTSDNTR
jgi:hypothetical protein